MGGRRMIGRWFWIPVPLLWCSAAFSDDIDDCNASGDNARAIKGCTSLINGGNLNRRNALRAFEHRASAYTETGDIDAAIADYTMSIEFNPTAEMSYDFRGRLHGKKADYVAAITDLTKSLELKPSIFAYADRAEIYEKIGDYARAIADYTKALESTRRNVRTGVYTKRADAFMASGDYKSAATDYTSAIDADPKHVQLSDRSSTTADLFTAARSHSSGRARPLTRCTTASIPCFGPAIRRRSPPTVAFWRRWGDETKRSGNSSEH